LVYGRNWSNSEFNYSGFIIPPFASVDSEARGLNDFSQGNTDDVLKEQRFDSMLVNSHPGLSSTELQWPKYK
jgi:hypothetical protein